MNTHAPLGRSLQARLGRWAVALLLAIIVLASLWTWLTLSWSYSEGQRAGVLQKFSNKGWLCKTYEGELAQYVVGGVAPQIWHFSVRDEAVAEQLYKVVGQNVQLRYTEHRGIPTSCFGDTAYFAVGVAPIGHSEKTQAGAVILNATPAAPAPAP